MSNALERRLLALMSAVPDTPTSGAEIDHQVALIAQALNVQPRAVAGTWEKVDGRWVQLPDIPAPEPLKPSHCQACRDYANALINSLTSNYTPTPSTCWGRHV